MKIAVISDVHEDVETLELAFRKIEKIKADEIVCLGDIIGFSVPYHKHLSSRNANKCIHLLSTYCKYVIVGNHDHYALRKLPMHIPYTFVPDNWYELTYDKRKEISNNKIWLYEENELSPLLNEKSLEWLNSLPEFVIANFGNLNIFFSHYIYPDITGFSAEHMTFLKNFKMHYDFVRQNNAQISFFGHLHPTKMLIFQTNGKILYKKNSRIDETLGVCLPPIVRNDYRSGFICLDLQKNKIELHYI
ncbi:MAG: metallophosphatase family protein [Bacteroidales bacterium]|nr:metallophosphatase family protein [Bacteroidales bacterium]